MDNQDQLQRRKAELKAKIDQQRNELKSTILGIREEMEPATVLRKAVRGALGFQQNKPTKGKPGLLSRLPAPILFLSSLLIKDPRWALGLKLISPFVHNYRPKFLRINQASEAENPEGNPRQPIKLLSRFRKGVSALRKRLKKTDSPYTTSVQP